MKNWKKGYPYTNKEKTLTSKNMKRLANDMMFDLIIDIRDKADYDKKHFKYSINLLFSCFKPILTLRNCGRS